MTDAERRALEAHLIEEVENLRVMLEKPGRAVSVLCVVSDGPTDIVALRTPEVMDVPLVLRFVQKLGFTTHSLLDNVLRP